MAAKEACLQKCFWNLKNFWWGTIKISEAFAVIFQVLGDFMKLDYDSEILYQQTQGVLTSNYFPST